MYQYDTVTQAVEGLRKRGYLLDFNQQFDCLVCNDAAISLPPSEFEIDEVHRFEGPSDPADEAIVYAIDSKHGQKGVLVNGYGISADPVSAEMVKKLLVTH